jgi:putative ABC transport system permease protein
MTVGIPALFAGYFLMAVPVTVACARLAGPVLAAVLRVPRDVLVRTILATPYRFGFTSGAMMMGLALMVGIWTNGSAIMRDWLGTLEFPDAFVAGVSLSEKTRARIDALPFVTATAAVSMQPLKTDAFGIKTFDNGEQMTTFVGFDPEPFFKMTRLAWVEGDPATALEKLKRGNAVIVAKEFKVTRGIGVGSTLRLEWDHKPHEFEVVGVVNSPGLDIASKFFSIGDDYLDQSVNAVFGSRDDLRRLFGNTGIQLIQVSIDPRYDDKQAIKEIRKLAGFEVVSAGSGREIKAEIRKFLTSTLFISSLVAVGAMLVACFGVANLIVAGIQARTFEFGVIRAIGGQRAVLSRLVLGEALVVALGACLMGTLMGAQISWGGQRMMELILGLVLRVHLPPGPIAAGWGAVTLITVGAAWPAIWALGKKQPRELLAVVRG